MVALSVITPTCGRDSLSAAVASIVDQLAPTDELVLVGDGEQTYARGLARVAREMTVARIVYLEAKDAVSQFGNAQRDAGLRVARGSHVGFLDDDDVYQPGALAAFRDAATSAPAAVHVFRAEWGPGHHAGGTVLWQEPVFRLANVGTPMVVYPRDRLPAWMRFNRHGTVSDFGWMQEAAHGREIVWHEQLVATVRP